MSRKKIVIVASLVFIIISILAGAEKSSKLNNETESKIITTPFDITTENSNQNYAIVNNLNFTISRIDIHNTNIENRNNAAFFLVFFDLENIGNEPKKQLYTSDILLKDSAGRTFASKLDAYTRYSITDDGFLQSGFTTSNHAVFTIAFDPNLGYTLFVKDRPINLGTGRDIGLDLDNAISFAVQNHDTSYCDMLTDDYNELGASKTCLGNYFLETVREPHLIIESKNSVSLNTCDSLEFEHFKAACYKYVAAKTKNSSICETSFNSDLSFKENCLGLISYMP